MKPGRFGIPFEKWSTLSLIGLRPPFSVCRTGWIRFIGNDYIDLFRSITIDFASAQSGWISVTLFYIALYWRYQRKSFYDISDFFSASLNCSIIMTTWILECWRSTSFLIFAHCSVLANIGGNLGLFLGYSFLTILLASIEAFKDIMKRNQTKQKIISVGKQNN